MNTGLKLLELSILQSRNFSIHVSPRFRIVMQLLEAGQLLWLRSHQPFSQNAKLNLKSFQRTFISFYDVSLSRGKFQVSYSSEEIFKSAIKFSKIRLRKWCKIFCPRTVNGDDDDDDDDDDSDSDDNCQTIFLNCFLQIIVPKPKILRTQKSEFHSNANAVGFELFVAKLMNSIDILCRATLQLLAFFSII